MKHARGWSFAARLFCAAPLAALMIGVPAVASQAVVDAGSAAVAGSVTDAVGGAIRDTTGITLPGGGVKTPDPPAVPDQPSTGSPGKPVDVPVKVPDTTVKPGAGVGVGVGDGSGDDGGTDPGAGTGDGTGSGAGAGTDTGAGVGAGAGAVPEPSASRPAKGTGSSSGTGGRTRHVQGTITEVGLTAGDSSDGDENPPAVRSGNISSQLVSAMTGIGWPTMAFLIIGTALWVAWQVLRVRREHRRARTLRAANRSFLARLPEPRPDAGPGAYPETLPDPLPDALPDALPEERRSLTFAELVSR